jgi:hypothetical protein
MASSTSRLVTPLQLQTYMRRFPLSKAETGESFAAAKKLANLAPIASHSHKQTQLGPRSAQIGGAEPHARPSMGKVSS